MQGPAKGVADQPLAGSAARAVGTGDGPVVCERTPVHDEKHSNSAFVLDGTADRIVHGMYAGHIAPSTAVTADSLVGCERATVDKGVRTIRCTDGATLCGTDIRCCGSRVAAIATAGLVGDKCAMANGGAATGTSVLDGTPGGAAAVGAANSLVADKRAVASGKAARQIIDSAAVTIPAPWDVRAPNRLVIREQAIRDSKRGDRGT